MVSRNVLILLVVCCLALDAFGATVFRNFRQKRMSADANTSTTTQNPKEICQRSTPCGWAVYDRYTRDIDYFMKNKCGCSDGKVCLRTDDDISVTAYVYRCKEDPKRNKSNES